MARRKQASCDRQRSGSALRPPAPSLPALGSLIGRAGSVEQTRLQSGSGLFKLALGSYGANNQVVLLSADECLLRARRAQGSRLDLRSCPA